MTKQVFARLTASVVGALLSSALIWSTAAKAQAAATDRQLMFELLDRIEQLEQEVRQLRGDLEVYRHRQEGLGQRLKVLESGRKGAGIPPDLDEDVDTIPPLPRQPTASLPPAAPRVPPVVPGQPPDTAPPTARPAPSQPATASEQAAYDTALNQLREGRFDQAIASFQEFLRNYPQGELAGNAQYWLGEAYYINRDYDNAKEAFISVGVNYPDSDKLPDTLLKLGNIYEQQGNKAKAREVLQKLVQTYPNSRAAGLAQKRLQALR